MVVGRRRRPLTEASSRSCDVGTAQVFMLGCVVGCALEYMHITIELRVSFVIVSTNYTEEEGEVVTSQ